MPGFLPKSIMNSKLDGDILGNVASTFGFNGGSLESQQTQLTSARLSVPRKTHSLSSAENNWNKAFPYLFFLAEEDRKFPGTYKRIGTDRLNGLGIATPTFRLEIPPQSLSLNPVFANSVTATNNGVLEENSGVLFRQIAIAGTTGLLPNRVIEGFKSSNSVFKGAFKNIVTNFFPGVNDAINNFQRSIERTVGSVVGTNEGKFVIPEDKINLNQTGFMKFWEFNNFLIAYAEAKAKTENNDLRLVFYSVKDDVGFVFTTQGMTMTRDAGNPLLYNYSMNMRAWDLFTENSDVPEIRFDFPQLARVNAIASVTEVLRNARTSIQSASNVIRSAVSDLNSIMNIYTQGVMVLSDTAALGVQMADVTEILETSSRVLIEGANNTLISKLDEFVATDEGFGSGLGFARRPISAVTDAVSGFPPGSTETLIDGAGGVFSKSNKTQSGETKVVPNSSQQVQALDALDKFLADPESGQTDITELALPEDVLNQVQAKVEDVVFNTTSNDIRDLAEDLRRVSDNLALEFNVMDEDYANVYGIDIPEETRGESRQISEDEIILLADIEESRISFLSTLATGELFREKEPDPFAIANESLQDDDQLTTPGSAFVVAYRRGATLESMAQEFLGDATRAREIALLNGLRAPFTDAEGFDIDIFNANGRSFVVRNEDRIVINQAITISGTGVPSTRRTVTNVVDIGNNEKRITVDGPNNLDTYTPATNPSANARIPGTVGPGDFLLMPSLQDSPDSVPTRVTPLWSRLRAAEKVFRVDMKLDEKFARDLVVTSDNDIDRVFGYDNAAQAIRLMVETEQGELEDHPGYGLAVPIAQRNSDIDIQEFAAAIEDRIKTDPRFLDVDAFLDIEGSVARTRVVARGAGGTGLIPLDFEIGRID